MFEEAVVFDDEDAGTLPATQDEVGVLMDHGTKDKMSEINKQRLEELKKALGVQGSAGVKQYVQVFERFLTKISDVPYFGLSFEQCISKFLNSGFGGSGVSSKNLYIAAINFYLEKVLHRSDLKVKSKKITEHKRQPFVQPNRCTHSHIQKFAESLKPKDKYLVDFVILARWRGLRIREICQLQKKDCLFSNAFRRGKPYVELKVKGKGDKNVTVRSYTTTVIEVVRRRCDEHNGHIFCPVLDTAGPLFDKILKREAKNISRQVGRRTATFWNEDGLSIHSFRRTFAADLFARNTKPDLLATLMRHSSYKDSLLYIGSLNMRSKADNVLENFAANDTFYDDNDISEKMEEFEQLNFDGDDNEIEKTLSKLDKTQKSLKRSSREEVKEEVSHDEDDEEEKQPERTTKERRSPKDKRQRKERSERDELASKQSSQNPEIALMKKLKLNINKSDCS